LGRLKQSWRAGETERGESLFARDDSSRFCPPVPDEIIESPCKNGRLGSGKETRRLNWLGTLNSVWTISFENKISLPGEKIARPIAVDHEASENRWRFEGRMMKCEGFALQGHEVRGRRDEMYVKRNDITFHRGRPRVASKSENGLDHPKTLLIDHNLQCRRL